MVALRKESVDRNIIIDVKERGRKLSLSARRAWIEISITQIKTVTGCVALRKESVDRNDFPIVPVELTTVALRKESVDRNCRARLCPICQWRRSPQGERG